MAASSAVYSFVTASNAACIHDKIMLSHNEDLMERIMKKRVHRVV